MIRGESLALDSDLTPIASLPVQTAFENQDFASSSRIGQQRQKGHSIQGDSALIDIA
jgi:hypothetical protein